MSRDILREENILSLSLDNYISQRVIRQEEQERKEALLRARLINIYEEFRRNPSHSDPYPSGTVLTLELELYLKRTCNHIDYFVDVLVPCMSVLLLMIMVLLTMIVVLLCLLRKDYSDHQCSAPCTRRRARFFEPPLECQIRSDHTSKSYESRSKELVVRSSTEPVNVEKSNMGRSHSGFKSKN